MDKEVSEDVELKPCPFKHKVVSGVGLNLWEEDDATARIIGGAWQSVVECYDCHATGESFSVPNKYDSIAKGTAAYRAISAWNTRASIAAALATARADKDQEVGEVKDGN